MSILWLAVGLVAVQRIAELLVARRNTRRLLAQGGHEVGAGQVDEAVEGFRHPALELIDQDARERKSAVESTVGLLDRLRQQSVHR